MKTILKVLYFTFAAIITFLVGLLSYNNAGYEHILKLSNNALAEKNYADIPKIFGGSFDTRSIATDNTDLFDLAIYPSSTLTSTSYLVEEEVKAINVYEDAYLIYLFNPTFDFEDIMISDSLSNKSGFKFSDGTNEYVYYSKITETINSDKYKESATTEEEAILSCNRDLTLSYTNWSFLSLTLTESMVEHMGLNGISSMSILDSKGEAIFETTIDLSFSDEYFNYVQPLCDAYNKYLAVATTGNDEEIDAATKEFNLFYAGEDNESGFKKEFLEQPYYSFRYDDDYLQPGKLVWSAIGMVVILIIAIALLYFLIFHFNKLKSLISGEARKKNYKYNPAPRKGAQPKTTGNQVVNKPAQIEEVKENTNTELEEVKENVENEESEENK